MLNLNLILAPVSLYKSKLSQSRIGANLVALEVDGWRIRETLLSICYYGKEKL